jgi:diacylglycerol kinase (ATP)
VNVLVIGNEQSGSSGEDVLRKVADALETLGEVTVLQPPSVEAFDEDVRRAAQGKDVVVAAGGDGTLHATVNALWDGRNDLKFAVVPMGTGNDFAHTLGLPEDPVKAARSIATAGARAIDVASVSTPGKKRLFINACMGGFPVAADKAIGGGVKKALGPFAFWVGGAKAAANLPRYRVRIGDRVWENATAVGFGNGRTAGGGIPIFPDADPADGRIDCCVFEVDAVSDALRTVGNIRDGSHAELDNVHAFTEQNIEVEADPELEFNIDGELLDLTTPATFALAGRIEFLIP